MGPLSAAAVARSRTLGEARWSPGGGRLGWLETSGGRVDLVVAAADGSTPPCTITAEAAVTPIGAYGGGGYCWASDREVVYAAADGRLVAIDAAGGPVRVLSTEGRAAAPAIAPNGDRVAFVLERDDACDVVVVALDGSSPPQRISDAGYAWDPAWSPDGRTLVWHEWDLPNMPWDGSRIALASIDVPHGSDPRPVVVAGGDEVAVGQPRFSPDGSSLAYVSDATGWMNVWVAAAAGSAARPLLDEAHEHAEPSWGPGQRSFVWSPDSSELALNRNEHGFGRLVIASGTDGTARDISRGWHHGLDWGRGGIACVRSGGRTAPQVTVLAPDDGGRRSMARGAVGELDALDLPEPDPVQWQGADGATVHGLLWRPGATEGRPPLLVDVHGGPTGQAVIGWAPRVRWFLSRGWAVLAPNPRGSTGYGRVYERALTGAWGELDVADTVAGILAAEAQGWADGSRVAIMGGSAGGLTALLVAAEAPAVVRAAVSLYGVTDLSGLAATTHRFESRYLDRLVGTLPDHVDRYRDRSPVNRARDITVPVLVLQGDADKVVPPAQAQAVVDALRSAGTPVEYHVYDGEGHGWSRPDTVVDALERTAAFLTRWVLQP